MSEQALMPPSVSYVAELSEGCFRKATRRYMYRRVAWQYVAIAVLLPLAMQLIFARRSLQGIVADPISVWAVPVLIFTGVFFFQYFKCLRSCLSVLRALKPATTAFTFTEEGIALTNSLASTRMKWDALKNVEIWRYPDLWLLFTTKHSWLVLPTAGLNDQSQQFLLQCVRARGGKIR